MALSRKRIGITFGAWDMVHPGHCLHFKECKKYCDYLIVGLQIDPSIDRPQKNKPIMSVEERRIMLEANKYVDAVLIYESEEEVRELDKWLGDIRFMGEDHSGGKHHYIKAKIIYTSRKHNHSSSDLRKRL